MSFSSAQNPGYGRGGGGYGGGRGGGAGYQLRDGDSQYLEKSQKVTSNIFTISQNVAQLSRFSSYIGTSRDVPEMRERMTQVEEQTRGIVKDTATALKALGHMDGGTGSEARERRIQQEKLQRDFKSVLQKFQTASQVAVGKMRETVTRERAASHSRGGGYAGGGSGGGYGASEAGNYSAGYGDDERTRLIEQEHRDKMEMMGNQIDYSTSLITEREDAIKEIESTMLEVNEIYKDLSTLVVEQGAALDNIEANMSVADANVESGAGQLSTASRYQKKARNKACICLLAVSIVLAILVVVLVTSLKK
eukprot:m.53384 g.53384  ORF g.53384 m.53384 type:complete len:307 (-) comp7455_c0_seq1:106-1026(-)